MLGWAFAQAWPEWEVCSQTVSKLPWGTVLDEAHVPRPVVSFRTVLRLIRIPISHYCEKARWALESMCPPLAGSRTQRIPAIEADTTGVWI